jgi:hypothetical protein
MDDDPQKRDLIDPLATRIGTFMEDASVVALTIAPRCDPARAEAIDDLELAATQIAPLVDAIRALQR